MSLAIYGSMTVYGIEVYPGQGEGRNDVVNEHHRDCKGIVSNA
jgi:hypothetical protein